MSRGSQAAPSLRQLTPPASLFAGRGRWRMGPLVARCWWRATWAPCPGPWAWAPVRSLLSGCRRWPPRYAALRGAVRVAVLAQLHRRPRLAAGCVRLRLPDRLDPGSPPRVRVARLASRAAGGHPTAATVLAVAIFAACGTYQLTPLNKSPARLARCEALSSTTQNTPPHRNRERLDANPPLAVAHHLPAVHVVGGQVGQAWAAGVLLSDPHRAAGTDTAGPDECAGPARRVS